MKVSVIVPAYNAADRLSLCLDSLLAQTESDFEVIIIDDGSTDRTAAVAKAYITQDRRVRYVRQANAGVSAARNCGLDEARGLFVAFADADDRVEPNWLADMLDAATRYDADIVFCGFQVIGSSHRLNDMVALRSCCPDGITGCITPAEAVSRTISIDPERAFYGYIWRNLFSRPLLEDHQVRFQTDVRISEDFQFILECLLHARSAAVVAKPLYDYVINEDSVTARHISTMRQDMERINDWMEHTILPHFPKTKNGLSCCVANTYLGIVQNLCRIGTPLPLRQRIAEAYRIKRTHGYRKAIRKAIRNRNRRKAELAFCLFAMECDWLYVLLFSLKEQHVSSHLP